VCRFSIQILFAIAFYKIIYKKQIVLPVNCVFNN
jgi:hypothetical protein